MKKIVLLVTGLTCFTAAYSLAQSFESGTVTYEVTTKLEFNFEGEMAQRMRDLPKERKMEYLLYISPEASMYERKEIDVNTGTNPMGDQRRGMRMMMNDPKNKVFIDLKKGEVIEQREFMTRMFLIKGDMPETEWKITGNQKMIMELLCIEATHTDTAGTLTRAWFTPAIQIQSGPGKYCNLPGLVLEVDENNGRRVLTVSSIDRNAPPDEVFKKPREGKKVTQEEYHAIVAEKMKEMGIDGQGNYMIRMQRIHR